MNILTNNTKIKKNILLILIFFTLFNLCYPCFILAASGPVSIKEAGDYEFTAEPEGKPWYDIDIGGALGDLIFWIERSLFGILNDLFCDSKHKYEYWYADIGEIIITNNIYLSPETIIKGKFLLFNANIFDPINQPDDFKEGGDTYADTYYDDGEGKNVVNGRKTLRGTISGWYYALRNFTIVGLLSVLVYVGIRMILSTISQDKAKYKIMFKDWLVALCLVIIMHLFMITILNFSDLIVKAIGTQR